MPTCQIICMDTVSPTSFQLPRLLLNTFTTSHTLPSNRRKTVNVLTVRRATSRDPTFPSPVSSCDTLFSMSSMSSFSSMSNGDSFSAIISLQLPNDAHFTSFHRFHRFICYHGTTFQQLALQPSLAY